MLDPRARRRRFASAAKVFFLVAGSWSAVGALLATLSAPSGSETPAATHTAAMLTAGLSGALEGATVGLGFGLMLAVPAALIIWFAGGRPSAPDANDQRAAEPSD